MEDTTTATPPLAPRREHIRRLAEIIWEVRDSYDIEAAALAEAILEHPGFSGCHDGPAALRAQGELGEVEGLLEFLDSLAALPVFDRECAARIRRVAEVLKGIPDMSPAIPAASPAVEELTRFATWLRSHSSQCVELGRPDWAHMANCAADLLQGFSRGGSIAPTVGQPTTPPPLPPGYIDAEHQGEDRKLLEAFQRAWWADGGRCVDRDMRGIWAVMAIRPTVAAVRAADAAIADEALEAEFRAWWKAKVHPLNAPRYHAVTTHLAWGRHLLSRGGL